MECVKNISTNYTNEILHDENKKEYLMGIIEENLISNINENSNNEELIQNYFLNFSTFEFVEKNLKIEESVKMNNIKVFNFYFKNKLKYQRNINIYKESKIKYYFLYLKNLTSKYIHKDLARVLFYTIGVFLAERFSFMIFKLIKKKRRMMLLLNKN